MKFTSPLFLLAAVSTAFVSAVEPTSRLRNMGETHLDRSHRDDNGGRDDDDDDKKKGRGHVRHEQAMVAVHGMTRHPSLEDMKVIDKAAIDAFNKIHPNSDWTMLGFNETFVQVFEEENDPVVLGGSAHETKVGRWNRPNWNWNLQDIFGYLGGYGTFSCELCTSQGYHRPRLSVTTMLGSSAVGDELCKQLVESGMEIFEQVYDCAMSAKPAAIAVVQAMMNPKLKATTLGE